MVSFESSESNKCLKKKQIFHFFFRWFGAFDRRVRPPRLERISPQHLIANMTIYALLLSIHFRCRTMWLLLLHSNDIQAHWGDACPVEVNPTKSVRPQYTNAGIRSRALTTSDDKFYIRLHTDNTRFSIVLAKLAIAKKENGYNWRNLYGEVIQGSVLVLFGHWIDDLGIEK